jgi:hypothetical protein
MTMTTEHNAMVLECDHCEDSGTYLPGAARLTLFTHGRMLLEFFCVHCREHNGQQLVRVDFAQALTEMGVPTTIVRVPLEVAEHPHDKTPAITKGAVTGFERMRLDLFNTLVERELKWDGRQ